MLIFVSYHLHHLFRKFPDFNSISQVDFTNEAEGNAIDKLLVLKITLVIPLLKKRDQSSVTNYRPISILPFISKIFEKLMYKRKNQFLSEHRIICKHQFGFRTGHSTSDAIIEFIDGVYDALDRGNALILYFQVSVARLIR